MRHAIGTNGRNNLRAIAWRGALVALVLLAGAGSASSQTSDDATVVRRLDAAEVKTRALENKLAADKKHLGSYRVADLFGESDEEKAARLQHEQSQDSSINGINQRMGDLEDSLRRVTGQVEQLDHRISELNTRIERMQKDFDYKLCALVAQQLGATAQGEDQNALPCPGNASFAPPPAAANPPPPSPVTSSSSGVIHLAPPPGVLGTLPSSGGSAATAPAPLASSPNRPQFDAAMNLLAKAQYDEARSAFRSFADSYPKDELTPQAVYWIGDIAYVQKDYGNAAHAFAEEIKKYPASPRAPESMLKLGQSLIALNQKQEGCTTLAALPSKYPGASKTVLARAEQERKTAACR